MNAATEDNFDNELQEIVEAGSEVIYRLGQRAAEGDVLWEVALVDLKDEIEGTLAEIDAAKEASA